MKRPLFLLSCLLLPLVLQAKVTVTNLLTEGLAHPLCLDCAAPRFSWRIESDKKDVRQTAYEIEVSASPAFTNGKNADETANSALLWRSGRVESDAQLWIPYGGKKLQCRQRCYWRVRVFTNKGASDWSEPAEFGMGMGAESHWGGRWIGLESMQYGENAGLHTRLAARYLRKEFNLQEKEIKRATVYVTGLGYYQLYINGDEIGQNDLFKPIPSDYRKTIYYNAYDVTKQLRNDPTPALPTGGGGLKDSKLSNNTPSPCGEGWGGVASVAIVLGNGRQFAVRQNKPAKQLTFGFPKCRLNLFIEYTDGSVQRINTDESWKITTQGPIRANNDYDGEEYDARMELGDWTKPAYDDSKWQQAERAAIPQGTLKGQPAPSQTAWISKPIISIKSTNSISSTISKMSNTTSISSNPTSNFPTSSTKSAISKSDKPSFILDFGQNLAGFIEFLPCGKAGDTIRIRYAERLNEDGTLYTDNLRDAQSEDIYVCNGSETQPWHATFVTHGFRYAEVKGLDEDTFNKVKDSFKAVVVSDEMGNFDSETGDLAARAAKRSTFFCSDTILNKVVRNAWWGILSNYKGMPVDCPQRNERQPWLGDRTVGALGESYMFQNERLYSKWMTDICESQRSDGCFSDVAPAYWNYYNDDVTWPAALPFICDMLYRQYGNAQPMIESMPYILKWIDHVVDEYGKNGIITKDKYGDWCVPPENLKLIHSADESRKTDGSLISTAYLIRVIDVIEGFEKSIISASSSINSTLSSTFSTSSTMPTLSKNIEKYRKLRDEMASAFNQKFLTLKRGTSLVPGHPLYPDSVFYGNNTATANLLPLAFGLVPDSLRQDIIDNIAANIIEKNNGHIPTGVIGTSWLLRTLSDNGRSDLAWLLATNSTYPSWGYMAEQGATTIWELWNGDKANPSMNSGNHVMLLGDLLTWCWEYIGGIKPTKPGFKEYELSPAFDIPDCFNADVEHESPYGTIRSQWQKTTTGSVKWNVTVPCNTTATVKFPDGIALSKSQSGLLLDSNSLKLGSGEYEFNFTLPHNIYINKVEEEAGKHILAEEFLYADAPFPQCHASTITELENGDLVAAYFGGTHERNPDVCIWVSRKPKGAQEWEKPILAGDGVFALGTEDARIAGVDSTTTKAEAGPIIPRMSNIDNRISIIESQKSKAGNRKSNAESSDLRRKACWNPVLFTMPDGEIWLFYKIGANVQDWTGWLVKSRDGGKTWSEREPLPEGFLGPVKNKPEIIDGKTLLCASSTEKGGWKLHFEAMDLQTKEWTYIGPIEGEMTLLTEDMEPASPRSEDSTANNKADSAADNGAESTEKKPSLKPIQCIQPSILRLNNGDLKVLMRTRNGRLAQSVSHDRGKTWSKVTLTDIPNNQSGTDAVTLSDGRHVLIYNNFATIAGTKKGPRTPLSLAISEDGEHFEHWITLEDSPISQYSYPAIIEGRDGSLHCVYTWRRQKVAYRRVSVR